MNVTRLVDASCRETDRAKSALIGIAGLEPDSVATAIDIVQHCAWAEPVGRGDSLHVRLGLDGDRLWIGPRFGGGDAGCSTCFRRRLSENHPRREEWEGLFGSQVQRPVSEFPLTMPLARIVLALVEALDHEASAHHLTYFILNCGDSVVERHGFFPDPECVDCGTRAIDSAQSAALFPVQRLRANTRSHRVANPALTRAALRDGFVDHRSGLIKHVFQDLNSQLMPMAGAEAIINPGEPASVGYGRASSSGASETVAILEALERFANSRPRGKCTSVHGSYAELRNQAIDPRLFTLHAPRQARESGYSLVEYNDSLKQNWVWAHSFRRREAVLIPEQLSYFGVGRDSGGANGRYVQHTSSGCALGGCIEEAILYGLFEVIERDAYMTGWYGRFAYPALDCAHVSDPVICALIARATAEGYSVHLFDMTLESRIPSIWAMIEDPRKDAPVRSYCAAASHIDPEKAIVAALVEVISSIAIYRKSMPPLRERARTLVDDPSQVQGMSDHVLLYSQPETMAWLEFLPRNGPRIPVKERFADWYSDAAQADLTQDLEMLVDRLLGIAHDVLVVDQSFAALAPLSLKAAQVSVPGLSPVSFGHQYRRVAHERIRAAASWLGAEHQSDTAVVEHVPHNFP